MESWGSCLTTLRTSLRREEGGRVRVRKEARKEVRTSKEEADKKQEKVKQANEGAREQAAKARQPKGG